jgi:putative acetyltransferase
MKCRPGEFAVDDFIAGAAEGWIVGSVPRRMKIRLENANDLEAIRDVVTLAFGQTLEAGLVERLRSDGDLVVSIVAEGEARLVGCVALSQIEVTRLGACIGPGCRPPGHAAASIGSALIRAALQEARRYGALIVFVLGDPRYYCRIGFSAVSAADYSSVFAEPHFMAVRLGSQQRARPELVISAPAFEEVERLHTAQRA